MSYGYLIITKSTPWLLKDRYNKFELTYEIDDLFFYTRLDESQSFNERVGDEVFLTQKGMDFLNKIASPMYPMYFLLKDKQGEYDVCLSD